MHLKICAFENTHKLLNFRLSKIENELNFFFVSFFFVLFFFVFFVNLFGSLNFCFTLICFGFDLYFIYLVHDVLLSLIFLCLSLVRSFVNNFLCVLCCASTHAIFSRTDRIISHQQAKVGIYIYRVQSVYQARQSVEKKQIL